MPIINPRQTPEGIAIERLERRVDNPAPFLNQVGMILVGLSQKAFRDQRFGKIEWPKRYPGQDSPKFNVAGAIADFAAGKSTPKANRWNDTPAAMDTGNLKNSITFKVTGTSVIVGTSSAHAQITQEGGKTSQPITDDIRKRLIKFLGRERRKTAKLKNINVKADRKALAMWESGENLYDPSVYSISDEQAAKISKRIISKRNLPRQSSRSDAASKHLGWLLARPKAYEPRTGYPGEVARTARWKFDKLDTEVNARPFVGLTDEGRSKIVRWGARWFATGQGAFA